ncbi:hypothetical protein [Enterobacter cancerogenus]|jgi:hypothetical protein|uniref:hypothetical protein n=1 Tax=Enterobacter cancerogenus TaxID=69218 RepID=UPI000536F2A6|nr:hypothetical protein [Enterobacter cancerogenus]KGT92355.1 hypothetical protein NH00_05600 [Enterobacter cancerogenus]
MSQFTKAEIDADMAMLTEKIASGGTVIASSTDLLKKSFFIPALSILLSLVNTWTFYYINSLTYKYAYSEGYIDFLMSDGWVVLIPTVVIGVLFSFMAYNNLLIYLTIPDEVRKTSLVVGHLEKIVFRTVIFFLGLMLISVILSSFISWFAFGVPILEFALFFVVNLIVGMEINRLGAGLALEKISSLIKKI